MKTLIYRSIESSVEARFSRFRGQSADEYHLVFHPLKPAGIETQLDWLSRAYADTLASVGISPETAVFRRFFCSDLTNQAGVLKKTHFSFCSESDNPCAISWICQPPGHTAKACMWAYHVCDRKGPIEKELDGNCLSVRRGALTHRWTAGVNCTEGESSYEQTRGIFDKYCVFLRKNKMTLADNVLRTWFFVKNIDGNYKGFVDARREYFAANGLTEKTHFISSTGVEGSHVDPSAKVTMDAYAVSGIVPKQVNFLYAPENLSSTYVYGVTFERGTAVSYRDRRHLIISGTASIDKNGGILYHGDVLRQLNRTVENMDALLSRGGAGLKNMAILIAYVRDPSDYDVVREKMAMIFPGIPAITLIASVCRPGWLVEVEGIAVIPNSDENLPPF
ncbi:MAG: translation initiation inhibitor [Candidatus Omnitrophica bacterium]|nr:translation initiation inhibitor [Candidatus Omnitrophota bacterium]